MKQTDKKNAPKAKSKAAEPAKKGQAKAATAETAAPAKSSAPVVSSKKVAKAPAVALKNLELAMKETAKKNLEKAASSAKKAAESSGKKTGAASETSVPVSNKKRAAPPAKKAGAPAPKKASPVEPPKKITPPAPKPEKKEVVAPKAETDAEITGKKTAAPNKPKPKPKRPKNVLRGKKLPKKKVWERFVIDCDLVAEDMILDVADFEKYLKTHIKVKNKINQLNDLVTFERVKNSALVIHSGVHFSKRYFKYLTKRYLKKHSLRDWVRIVSTGKDTFSMCYFNIQGEDDDDEDDAKAEAKAKK